MPVPSDQLPSPEHQGPARWLIAAAALGFGVAAMPGHAQDMPARRAGLWQLTLQVSGAPAQQVRQCIDARTDRQMQYFNQGTDTQACARNEWRQEGDRFVGESECRFGSSVSTTRSVLQGDFSKAYKGEIESRIEPPLAGMSQTRVSLSARWVGNCPSGWKPGDLEMPGGMGRMNVNDFPAGRAARPPR